MRFEKGRPLKELTTLGIGGKARFFVEIRKEGGLKSVLKNIDGPWYVLGSGSNIVASDDGYRGTIIKISIKDFKRSGNKVYVGAGNNLLEFINKINKLGLGGMERMAGIPGTVAGAVYGNAGAYGQEIVDNLKRIRIFDVDAKKFKWLSKKEAGLSYRESNFKKNKNWIIVGAEFDLATRLPSELAKISKDTINLRLKRYPRGMLCPGSFFKNIKLFDLKPATRKKLLSRIDKSKIMYSKVPVGYLLEEVGAKGMRVGKIKVAGHHGNLFYNASGGKASDIKKLAAILRNKVYKKFGVRLEEEIQYLG